MPPLSKALRINFSFLIELRFSKLFCFEPLKIFKKIKSNVHHTSLIPFRVSRVSGAHLRDLRQGPHIRVATVASRWRRMGDLPRTSRIKSECLTTWANLFSTYIPWISYSLSYTVYIIANVYSTLTTKLVFYVTYDLFNLACIYVDILRIYYC